MPTNEVRRELLNRIRATGYPGGITEVFQAADQGIDLIQQHQMQQEQQQMQVAQTPQEQEIGLREQHAMGNTQASMVFPDVQPNQSFNTVGMRAPIDIQKIDNQGHLVESYKNVPPGIQDLPTGPSIDAAVAKLAARRCHPVARRAVPGQVGSEVAYFSVQLLGPEAEYLVELTFKSGVAACKVCVKTTARSLAPLGLAAICALLRAP